MVQHAAPGHLLARRARRAGSNHRTRGGGRDRCMPYVPPEDWHEPTGRGGDYRIVVRPPGDGYIHVVTPAEVRHRLDQLPREFLEPLEVVQLSQWTRKKSGFPCYGMQWGAAIYLYPIETDLVETYSRPPMPAQVIEARMYGGRWVQKGAHCWQLVWTPRAIKDFYLNNVLIHELGHLLDDRNANYVDRERFAEWFAVRYGYKPSRRSRPWRQRRVVRRHHAK